ncbi:MULTISPECIES: arylsulfotransferase family protein [Streptacidiphilus]|uniref:Arylsulfotransferase family protein n=1 Tax=Streptacidiphilus cavernicola TaxID=3342716 RepID=A0ABV6UR40_9ACTN|nr:arylsulfotransferase family protein [Streptacidiphilus jeojiense]
MPANQPDSPAAKSRSPRRTGIATGAAVAAAAAAVISLPGSAAHAATATPLFGPLQVTTDSPRADNGDIFLTPTSATASGVEILSPDGSRVVWSHLVPAGETAADFREQTYRGHQVLTWWQGTGLGGVAAGEDVIYDENYHQIATVRAGNGYSADGHEFTITSKNTALIVSYTTATADLTSIGGRADQEVIDGLVQEIDIRTGKVLFQWNSADHVPYGQSEQPLPASSSTPWDWFHVNAVKVDTDGNLLVDARDTWTTYKVNRRTGRIIWQLGGKASSFKPVAAPGQSLNTAGTIFAWQHDPEPLGGDRYSVFDNESAGTANTGQNSLSELPWSRTVTVKLDLKHRVATLVSSNDSPDRLSSPSQGDAQPLSGGHQFVGWGAQNYVSEFDAHGKLVFQAELPAEISYRAYRFSWKPTV